MLNSNIELTGYRAEFHAASSSGSQDVDINLIIYRVQNTGSGGQKINIVHVVDLVLDVDHMGGASVSTLTANIAKVFGPPQSNEITDYFIISESPIVIYQQPKNTWSPGDVYVFKEKFNTPIPINGTDHEGIVVRAQSKNTFSSSHGADFINIIIEYNQL